MMASKEDRSDAAGAGDESGLRDLLGHAALVCEAAARGDLEARLIGYGGRDDEMGRMAFAINHLLDLTDAYVRESRASLEAARDGRFYRRLLQRGLRGTFCSAAGVINAAIGAMEEKSKALDEADRQRQQLASDLESGVGSVVATIASSATELSATAASLAGGAASTTERVGAVREAAVQTMTSMEAVASATEELTSTAAEIERQVTGSRGSARAAVDESERANATVSQLAGASQRIGGVVRSISAIAHQTNLLALNATIEAARAGEAGKGFVVVASEVKTLARQTADATHEIETHIEAIRRAAGGAAQAIDGIGTTIRQMSQSVDTIATSAGEQRVATEEISRSVQQTASSTAEISRNTATVSDEMRATSDAAEQVLQAAGDLSRQAEALRAILGNFLDHIRGERAADRAA